MNLSTLPASKYTSLEDYLRQEGMQEDKDSFVQGGFIDIDVAI